MLLPDGLPAGTYTVSFKYNILKEVEPVESFLLHQTHTLVQVPLDTVNEKAVATFTVSADNSNKSQLRLYGNKNSATSVPNEVAFRDIMIEHGDIASQNYSPKETPPGTIPDNEIGTKNLFSMSREVWKYAGNKVSYNYDSGIINFSNALYQYRYEVEMQGGKYTFAIEDVVNPNRDGYPDTVTAQLYGADQTFISTIGIMGKNYNKAVTFEITPNQATTNRNKFYIQLAIANSGRHEGRIVRPQLVRGTILGSWSLSVPDTIRGLGSSIKAGTKNLISMSESIVANASNISEPDYVNGIYHFRNAAYGYYFPIKLYPDKNYLLRIGEIHNPDWAANPNGVNIILRGKDRSTSFGYVLTGTNTSATIVVSEDDITSNGKSNEFYLYVLVSGVGRVAGYLKEFMVAEGDILGDYALSPADNDARLSSVLPFYEGWIQSQIVYSSDDFSNVKTARLGFTNSTPPGYNSNTAEIVLERGTWLISASATLETRGNDGELQLHILVGGVLKGIFRRLVSSGDAGGSVIFSVDGNTPVSIGLAQNTGTAYNTAGGSPTPSRFSLTKLA